MELKNTRLDDNADIYQKRSGKTEHQKFSELHGKEKWQYFKDYYLKVVAAVVVVLGFAGYFIYTVFIAQRIDTVLNVAIADFPIKEEILKDIQTKFGEYIGINKESQQILLDNKYYMNTADYTSSQKLFTYIMNGEIDIMIARESVFKNYVFNGSMSSLTDSLPSDLYSMFSDHFYYGKVRQGEEASMEESSSPTGIYGIYLDECALFKEYSLEEDRFLLGIISTGKHPENTIEFIRYLFQEYTLNE